MKIGEKMLFSTFRLHNFKTSSGPKLKKENALTFSSLSNLDLIAEKHIETTIGLWISV